MKETATCIIVILSFVLLWGVSAHGLGRPSHMDSFKNPQKCAACHAGRGAVGTPLLRKNTEGLCFSCHGLSSRGAGSDIESLFSRPSTHPLFETAKFHEAGEVLPEELPSMPRHVSCADCHVTHLSEENMPWRGAKGYLPGQARGIGGSGARPTGMRIRQAEEDHQLCYLCHADSANLPFDSRDVAFEFNPSNASFHPVETTGRNMNVPSLIRDLSVTSRIGCGSCHGNSDSTGPAGPHGSDYSPILVAQYRTENGPEEPTAYELCYVCHERRSLLLDESFRHHNLHIVQAQAACFTCHASHGSRDNTNLIEFNGDFAWPSETSGGPDYLPGATGSPKCFLSCHTPSFPQPVIHNSSGVEVPGMGLKPWPF